MSAFHKAGVISPYTLCCCGHIRMRHTKAHNEHTHACSAPGCPCASFHAFDATHYQRQS